MDKKDIKLIKKDFIFLKDKVLGVLLFGSILEKRKNKDIDICIVAPKCSIKDLLYKIFSKVDTYSKRYDVFIFEELPLYMKFSVIQRHKVLFAKNLSSLYEYFYFYRKFLEDFKHRSRIANLK